jgi:threonine/homoserine/homoserine lactone efflux protein
MLLGVFLQAMLIGLAIAAPVGPIGLLCIQRTLTLGFGAGLATGLGAAAADGVYGLLAALGVGAAQLFELAPPWALRTVGGAVLLWLAWGIWRSVPTAGAPQTHAAGAPAADQRRSAPGARALAGTFAATFGLTLANPMTIASFAAIMASFAPGMPPGLAAWQGPALIVSGVMLGSALWWLLLAGAGARLGARLGLAWLRAISRASALVIAAFGLAALLAAAAGGPR